MKSTDVAVNCPAVPVVRNLDGTREPPTNDIVRMAPLFLTFGPH